MPSGTSGVPSTNGAGIEAITTASVTFGYSPVPQIVGLETTFFANATSDIPSATLTFTIFYDCFANLTSVPSGGFTVNTTGNPGQIITKHTYSNIGNFTDSTSNPFHWAVLYVSDGSQNYSKSLKVYTNEAPGSYYVDAPIFPTPGPGGWFYDEYIYFLDNNSDMVNITWNWGDGTSTSQDLMGSPSGALANASHSWSNDTIKIPGRSEYYVNITMNITLSDGFNPKVVYPIEVIILFPFNVPPKSKSFSVTPTTVSPLEPVSFSAMASDYEGEALTWTFDYGDGSLEVFHTGVTGSNVNVTQNATHGFAAPGDYTASVFVSDSVVPYQIGDHNVSQSKTVTVKSNVAPYAGDNITASPTSPKINATLGYVNVVFQIDAGDLDRDGLTVTWDLGDGITFTNTTTDGNRTVFKQSRHFTETGDFNVSVTITDGRPGHEIFRNLTIHVTSDNRGPTANLDFKYAHGEYGTPNETIKFTLVITDLEHDVIEVIWDFGDGSAIQYFNLTEFSGDNTTLVVSHMYVEEGKYNMTIQVTDNKIGYLNHSISLPQQIVIYIQPVKAPVIWDWWDYTSLSIVALIPIAVVVRMVFVGKRRRRLEEQGISMEEAKLRKELHLDREPHEVSPSKSVLDTEDDKTKEEEL